MKLFILFVMLVTSHVAWANSPFYLKGDWMMTQRSCRSGAPPWDNFVPGRDRIEVSFGARHYTLQSRVAGCEVWTAGPYDLRDGLLFMRVETSQSSCGPANPIGATFSYRVEFDSRSVFRMDVGPLYNGGPCPAGDFLEQTFEKFR